MNTGELKLVSLKPDENLLLLMMGATLTPERRLSGDAADAPADKHTSAPG